MAHGTQLTRSQLQRSDLTSGGTDRMAIGMSVGFTHAGAAPVSGSPVTRTLTGASCSGEAIFVLAASITKLGSCARVPGNNIRRPFCFFAACKLRGRGHAAKVSLYMEADRLKDPARNRFSPEASFALNERAVRRGRFPCS